MNEHSSTQDGDDRIELTRRTVLRTAPVAGLVGIGSGTALAGPDSGSGAVSANESNETFPDVIALPDGFQPEGIATGRGTTFFVGSLASGDVYRGDLRTGEGEVFVEAPDGRVAVGLSYDRRSDHLFVAGDATGEAYVYDADSGDTVETYELADSGTFVNDVVVTSTAAYFTDSFRPALYRLPLGPGGRVPEPDAVEEIELGGEYESVAGFNANGIDAPPDEEYLLVVNSSSGVLYRVDPESGDAMAVDLGGETLENGDGILLDGKTLYVVRNSNNLVAVVDLDPGATEGEVVDGITDPAFDVPTTVAEFGNDLYAVNARFGVQNPESAEYDVVRVSK